MRRTLIVYNGKTGFTQKYAGIIAKAVGCEAKPLKEVSAGVMSEYERVVFGGRVLASTVDGLGKAKKMFEDGAAKELVVFATGATPNSAKQAIDGVWKNSLTPEELENTPHFYMQGGVNYEKMPALDRAIMKLGAKMMAAQKKEGADESDFMPDLSSSFDISSKECAEPIIKYLLAQE